MVFLLHAARNGWRANADLTNVNYAAANAIVEEDVNHTHMKVLEQALKLSLMMIGML